MKRICVQEEICSGCRACEVACVVHHDGRFGTATARIRVIKIESQGLDRPQVCRHCRPAPCSAACPAGALERDHSTGAIILAGDLCVGCGDCATACPFDVVVLGPENDRPLICDLCQGNPACVARCATGAIRYAQEAKLPPGRNPQ